MSKRILIVDDEGDFVRVAERQLGLEGYEVDACFDGGQALDKLRSDEEEYNLVLMDYFMPSLKGDEACQTIRENPQLKDLPIVVMTAFKHYPESFFLEKGATEVIYKPFDLEELLEKVKKYLKSIKDLSKKSY